MRNILLCISFLLGLISFAKADAKLRDGDVFEMRVGGVALEFSQDINQTYVVDEGSVNIPMIGRVTAVGQSATQLASSIEKRFRDAKIFTSPTVNINMAQNPRTITVGGAVRSPGRQQWSQDMTLSQAIASAAGPSEYAEDKVKIVRSGKMEMFSRKAIKKDATKDPKVLPGDFIEVEGEF
jgi:protein involved in polysaccharide export with SLBB domain